MAVSAARRKTYLRLCEEAFGCGADHEVGLDVPGVKDETHRLTMRLVKGHREALREVIVREGLTKADVDLYVDDVAYTFALQAVRDSVTALLDEHDMPRNR